MSTKKIVRTTLALPDDLLAATDRAVQEGKARSRNEFVAIALRHELAALKRTEIDAAFALMSDDEQYKSVAVAIANDFSSADWEALKLSEA
ncbi:ribbon-helix-helix domain-containing protein [Synechocystis sp. PCC 7509]|uniref:ribbon-helix-helix domain-containing protein n=1 Tax=Synechocystis sp. PCC 7509 TaxID=927677 RepID=UPI0002AC58B1|nr:ribbon-helix-helix domain-containing protein [Synechocystis sp. PCC 7509]